MEDFAISILSFLSMVVIFSDINNDRKILGIFPKQVQHDFGLLNTFLIDYVACDFLIRR